MKKLLFLLLIACSISFASNPTSTDTLGRVNGFTKFKSIYNLSVSTTADTLTLPFMASWVEIIHQGAATGDTLQVAYTTKFVTDSTYNTGQFSEWVFANGDVVSRGANQEFSYRNFGGAVVPVLNRLIVKKKSGSNMNATISVGN